MKRIKRSRTRSGSNEQQARNQQHNEERERKTRMSVHGINARMDHYFKVEFSESFPELVVVEQRTAGSASVEKPNRTVGFPRDMKCHRCTRAGLLAGKPTKPICSRFKE